MLKENCAVLFQDGKVLLFHDALPDVRHAAALPQSECGSYASLGPAGCVWGRVTSGVSLPDGWSAVDRRAFGETHAREEFKFMATGWGLSDWHHQSQFCGVCGEKMIPAPNEEHAMKCPRCGHLLFPIICPTVIVSVVREGKILLMRDIKRPLRMSVLSGFIEVGESLEDTISREVREEVGIEIDRGSIRYLFSQYWPFPRSFMLACTAGWKSGELQPRADEILEAGWFAPDEIPENVPGEVTVAGWLIREFVKKYRSLGVTATTKPA